MNMPVCVQYGIDPAKVTSTGPKGLLKTDIMKYIADNDLTALKVKSPEKSAAPVSKPKETVQKKSIPKPVGTGTYTDIPLTSMRSVIGK